jgi:hypothetical protein
MVLAFSADDSFHAEARETVLKLDRASGSASTDAEGRFQISGLPVRDYLIVATPMPLFPSGGPVPTRLYATTFHPSTLDEKEAVPVSASTQPSATAQIELVPVRGARVAGSVVSASGRPTKGLSVRLFHRVGGFGTETNVASVSSDGTFEIPRVPPGWYRLTVGSRTPVSEGKDAEFADKLIEVRDHDLDDLSFVLGPGASIAGRVVAESGTIMPSPIGLRVSASSSREQYSPSNSISVNVARDGNFRMAGLSGSYQLTASGGGAPGIKATRISLNGKLLRAGAAVELSAGSHEVVVFVAPREPPQPVVDTTLPTAALIEAFKREKIFWRQFEIAKTIVDRRDASTLPSLTSWLDHEDRHIRGNVAFIFGGLGNPIGLRVITEILDDRSDRLPGQGIAAGTGDGRYHLATQIKADRYYAAHLLGDLRDPAAVPVLLPLLKDPETNTIVPWALGQIGDARAIGPLLDTLDDEDPWMCVLAISALQTLQAREAIPRLISLLSDDRKAGSGVSVADAAYVALAKLRK